MPEPKDEHRYVTHVHDVTLVGRVVVCKCGRPLLADASSVMARIVPTPSARCLEYVELTDAFRQQSPDVAALIDRWQAEFRKDG